MAYLPYKHMIHDFKIAKTLIHLAKHWDGKIVMAVALDCNNYYRSGTHILHELQTNKKICICITFGVLPVLHY